MPDLTEEERQKLVSATIQEVAREIAQFVVGNVVAQIKKDKPDVADIIAGALGTSRAQAYQLMREAIKKADQDQ